MTGQPILHAKNLVKTYSYGDKYLSVIREVDLSLYQNEFVVITGKSGSGKSTLLYLLSGLEMVSSGSVIYRETDLCKCSQYKLAQLRREDFGFIFQSYNLIQNLTIEDNISFPLDLRKIKKTKVSKKVRDLAQYLDIEPLLKKRPHQLSGGEQQRVAIARAIVMSPKILFADEPTGNLDSENSELVMALFRQIRENLGLTILMVTHDEAQAKQANRTILLKDGKITQ